jgi:VIT1/CCC1 family predicted Fe2+/Mn2+ transporter
MQALKIIIAWFLSLPDEVRLTLVGLAAERLAQGLKWLAPKIGLAKLSQAKLAKFALAIVSGAAVAIAQTGLTPAFWDAWLTAVVAAVFLHEAGAQVARAVKEKKRKKISRE